MGGGGRGEGKTDANSKFFIFGLRSNLSSDPSSENGYQGSYAFLNKKFKDFQGNISHVSMTTFSAKQEP